MRAASYAGDSSLIDPSATLWLVAVSAGSGSVLVLTAVAYLCCRKPNIEDVEKNDRVHAEYYNDPDYEDVGLPDNYYSVPRDDIHYEDLPDIQVTKNGTLGRSYENAGGAYYNDKFHVVAKDGKENDYLEPINLVPTGNVTSNVIKTVQRIEAYKTNSKLGVTLDDSRNDGENIVIRESLELLERERELKGLSVVSGDGVKNSDGSDTGIESGNNSTCDPDSDISNGMNTYLENILGGKGDALFTNSDCKNKVDNNACVKAVNSNFENVPPYIKNNRPKPEIAPKGSYVKMLVKSLSQDVIGTETSRSRVTRNDTQPLRRKLEASQSSSGPFGARRESRVQAMVRSLSQTVLETACESDEYQDVGSILIKEIKDIKEREEELKKDSCIASKSIDCKSDSVSDFLEEKQKEQITSDSGLNNALDLRPNMVLSGESSSEESSSPTTSVTKISEHSCGNVDGVAAKQLDDRPTGEIKNSDLSSIFSELQRSSLIDEESGSDKQCYILDEVVEGQIFTSSACVTSRSMVI